MDPFVTAYIEAILFTGTDESDESGGEPLDRNYSADDLAPEALTIIVADCEAFQRDNAADLAADLAAGTVERAAHDLWFTRTRQGAGFWDGDWREPEASRLTDAAHKFGEQTPYIGDDGLIYLA